MPQKCPIKTLHIQIKVFLIMRFIEHIKLFSKLPILNSNNYIVLFNNFLSRVNLICLISKKNVLLN